MAYYKTCPYCGDNNDPGERCSCQNKTKADLDSNACFTKSVSREQLLLGLSRKITIARTVNTERSTTNDQATC